MSSILQERIPKHLAIIMDGNGRWARNKDLDRPAGHGQGAEITKDIVTHYKQIGGQYLTLFAFSAENWLRPKSEVDAILCLLLQYLTEQGEVMIREKIKFVSIGDRSSFPPEIVRTMNDLEEITKNHEFTLTLALGYGGRQAIAEAAKQLLLDKSVNPDQIASELEKRLNPNSIPDPDLLIRTGGEMRLSNFMLWNLAYSELYFTPTLWPDFTVKDLDIAIKEFQKRKRRYGLVEEF